MPFVAWLLSLVAPIVMRAVVALGFTAMTFTGVTVAVAQLLEAAKANWSNLPVSVMQIASMSGIPESIGIIAGAYVARVSLWAAVNGTKYVLKS